jgi:hypothetical protein
MGNRHCSVQPRPHRCIAERIPALNAPAHRMILPLDEATAPRSVADLRGHVSTASRSRVRPVPHARDAVGRVRGRRRRPGRPRQRGQHHSILTNHHTTGPAGPMSSQTRPVTVKWSPAAASDAGDAEAP